jgi:hypothetical protein
MTKSYHGSPCTAHTKAPSRESATGRRIAVKGVVIDRVVDGKWKDSRIMMDNLALLQQLGALPATPTSQIA